MFLDRRTARSSLGFLGVEEVQRLGDQGVIVLDPNSTLVSPDVEVGQGTILWPNTTLQTSDGGRLTVGAGAMLYPGTRIVAAQATVTVGTAEIGEEGGFTIKAEGWANPIMVEDGARLLGGGSLTGANTIGRGAQVLGPIRCRDCHLENGDTYRHPEPDQRGGVLKGSGVAYGISVPRGHVIQAFGLFSDGVLRQQSFFHPQRPA